MGQNPKGIALEGPRFLLFQLRTSQKKGLQNSRPPVDPCCVAPLFSVLAMAPCMNGSIRIVGVQVVGVHWGPVT